MDTLTAALVAVEENADRLRGAAGADGRSIRGPQGVKGERGEPGLVWRGAWKSDVQYDKPDVVESEGSAYVATGRSRGDKPPKGPWDLLASRGADGAPGMNGRRGSSSGSSVTPAAFVEPTTATPEAIALALIAAGLMAPS